MTVNYF